MASTPSPIGTVVTTLPVSASITAIILLSQPEKMTAGLGVHRHAGRFFARRERPLVEHRERLRIDLHHFALVFDIDVDVALAIGRRELRLPFQRHRSGQRSLLGVHRGGARAAAIEGEHALAAGS